LSAAAGYCEHSQESCHGAFDASTIFRNPLLQASEAMHALKRVGEPDEVAAALEFFMNPSNSFITGALRFLLAA